jgi:hypothetical protein
MQVCVALTPAAHLVFPTMHPVPGHAQLALFPLCWQVCGDGHALSGPQAVHALFMMQVCTPPAPHLCVPSEHAFAQQRAVELLAAWQLWPA